ncbi:Bgt-2645 [Blumeria graminis f. sp. tritici]|uniref:Bgt-2645 n=1 Tax=Blumeria graminis f. sp. tritici TaxID=62690 RepID=A0A9X9MMT0_BLUGR|nr:Bgt-2645 [Blumeria graminis f. sp. tritici]
MKQFTMSKPRNHAGKNPALAALSSLKNLLPSITSLATGLMVVYWMVSLFIILGYPSNFYKKEKKRESMN